MFNFSTQIAATGLVCSNTQSAQLISCMNFLLFCCWIIHFICIQRRSVFVLHPKNPNSLLSRAAKRQTRFVCAASVCARQLISSFCLHTLTHTRRAAVMAETISQTRRRRLSAGAKNACRMLRMAEKSLCRSVRKTIARTSHFLGHSGGGVCYPLFNRFCSAPRETHTYKAKTEFCCRTKKKKKFRVCRLHLCSNVVS